MIFLQEQNSNKIIHGPCHGGAGESPQHIAPNERKSAISKHSCFSALYISEILHLHKSKIGKLCQCIDVDKKFRRKVSVYLAKICPCIFDNMQTFSFILALWIIWTFRPPAHALCQSDNTGYFIQIWVLSSGEWIRKRTWSLGERGGSLDWQGADSERDESANKVKIIS